MAFIKYNDDFNVETIKHNKVDELRVRWWEYKIISKLPEKEVKEFCYKILHPKVAEYKKDNIFAPEVVEFKVVINLENPQLGDMYYYLVKKETTS